MYISNIFLIQWLYGSPPEVALVLSASFVIPNILQAFVNVFMGILIFIIIPENLAIQARFGIYGTDVNEKYEELSEEELNAETELSHENQED
ncbi:MAG: hypothetical protein ACTSW8_08115, partial [Candidatus Thorarchaeota archaeon]